MQIEYMVVRVWKKGRERGCHTHTSVKEKMKIIIISTQSDQGLTSFSLAEEKKHREKEGGETRDERTQE